MKLLFTPFSIALGLAAGIAGRKIFEQIWGLIDKDEPPHPQHRETGGFVKLLGALVLEGAIFRLVRGLADHGARHSVAKVTGSWPGDERPGAGVAPRSVQLEAGAPWQRPGVRLPAPGRFGFARARRRYAAHGARARSWRLAPP